MKTTPEKITPTIRRLCRVLKSVSEPLFVVVSHRRDSVVGATCFYDVQRQIREHGGEIQHGWVIWEWRGVLVEAIFHGVWKRPSDGIMIDVSFKEDGEGRVLFAPDAIRTFNDKLVPAVSIPIGKEPIIQKYISMKARFEGLVSDRYRSQLGEHITLDPELTELHARILDASRQLQTLGRSSQGRNR